MPSKLWFKKIKIAITNDIAQISALCALFIVCICFIFAIVDKMHVVVNVSKETILEEEIFEEVQESVIVPNSSPVLLDRYKVCEEELLAYCDTSNCYRREILFVEHEIAPIVLEFVAELPEEQMLSPVIDNDFELFTTYRDYENKNVKKLPMSEKGQKIVYSLCKKYDLPYKIVLALLGTETHWNEDPSHVEGEDGRYVGIGCVNKIYHAEKMAARGIDIFTLEGNIEAICWLLREGYDVYGSINYALMSYNGGPSYARYQKENGVTETSYIKKLMWYTETFN